MTKQTKQCRECKEELPLDKFGRSGKSRDGLMYMCKTCHKRQRDDRARLNTVTKSGDCRDPHYTKILLAHGYSSACFYQRLVRRGTDPKAAERLARAAYHSNDLYGRLRRQISVSFRR